MTRSEPIERDKFQPRRNDPCFCDSGRRFKTCCGSRDPGRPLPHGIGIQADVVDADTRRRWINELEAMPQRAATVLATGRTDGDGSAVGRASARRTGVIDAAPISEALVDVFRTALRGPVREALGATFDRMERPEVLRYGPGDRFDLHADSEHYDAARQRWRKVIDRDVSLLLYLNDDFGGGELEFLHFGFRYRPRAGDLVWFPSDHRYLHQAHPVTEGHRWVAACWASQIGQPRVGNAPPKERIEVQSAT